MPQQPVRLSTARLSLRKPAQSDAAAILGVDWWATAGSGGCRSTALLHWAREALPTELIVARIRPTNPGSQRVATKIGLRRDPAFDDQGEDGVDWAYTGRT